MTTQNAFSIFLVLIIFVQLFDLHPGFGWPALSHIVTNNIDPNRAGTAWSILVSVRLFFSWYFYRYVLLSSSTARILLKSYNLHKNNKRLLFARNRIKIFLNGIQTSAATNLFLQAQLFLISKSLISSYFPSYFPFYLCFVFLS